MAGGVGNSRREVALGGMEMVDAIICLLMKGKLIIPRKLEAWYGSLHKQGVLLDDGVGCKLSAVWTTKQTSSIKETRAIWDRSDSESESMNADNTKG